MNLNIGSTDKSMWALPLDASYAPVTLANPSSVITALGYSRFLGGDRISQVINLTPTNLAAETDAHSDGGVFQRTDKRLRIDLPDAAWATGADRVEIYIVATGVTYWVDEPVDLVTLDVNVTSMAANTLTASALATDAANKVADHVRRRTQANVEASSDGDAVSVGSEYGLIQQVQESAISGATLTIYKVDGTTSLGTKTVASDASADPVVGIS